MPRIKSSFSAPLLVLVIYALLVLSRYINIESMQTENNIYLSMIILQLLIFVLPSVFYCKLKGKKLTQKIAVEKISGHKIGFIVTSFFVLILGSALLNTAVFYIFGSTEQTSLYNTFNPLGDTSLTNIAYIIISLCIFPALTEEFTFRGIILSEYSDYGAGVAMLMSSIMFAMLHFNISRFIVYLFCGIVAAYTVYITRSVVCGMILHLLNNLYSMFFESALWNAIKSPNSLIFFILVITTLFIVFLVLSFNSAERILYIAGINGEKSPPEAEKKQGGIKLLFESLLSPSFIACVIVFLIVTLVL